MAHAAPLTADELRRLNWRRDGFTYLGIAVAMLLLMYAVVKAAKVFQYYGDEIPMLGGICLVTSVVLGAVSFYKLYRAGVVWSATKWMARKLWAVRYWLMLCSVCGLIYWFFKIHAVRVSALVLAPALLLGYVVAGVARWLSGRLARRSQFALAMLSVAMPLFYLLACGVEITAVAREWWIAPPPPESESYYLDFRTDKLRFAGTLPETVRAAVWNDWAKLKRQSSHEVFKSTGFVPVRDLTQEVKTGGYAVYAVMGLIKVDQAGALAHARAIPPATAVNAEGPAMDFNAGLILGLCGTDDDVRQRLNGTYGGILVDGIFGGLIEAKREKAFVGDAERLIRDNHARRTLWYVLYRSARERFIGLARELIATADQESVNKLMLGKGLMAQPEIAADLLQAANRSVRRVYFAFAFNQYGNRDNTAILKLLKRAARGELPETDAYEQRAAAICLRRLMAITPLKVFNQSSKPVAGPLNADEEADIKKIVQQVDGLLDEWEKSAKAGK